MAINWSDGEILEKGARDFVDHIEHCANASLSSFDKFEPGDRAELERALRNIRPSFDEIAKWFIEPLRESKPSLCMYGYEKLWKLMAAAFQAGVHGTVTDSAKKYFAPQIEAETLVSRAEGARAAKKPKTDQNSAALRSAIIAITQGVSLNDSEKFAGSIRSEVIAKLPHSYTGGKSSRTIRRAIEAILKECEKK